MADVARNLWVTVHRCIGLAIAGFLFVAGLTGAIISWDHELDEWLNPHLFEVHSRGAFLDPFEMGRKIEAEDPHASVYRIPLLFEEGRSAVFLVAPKIDPKSKRPFEIGYNELYLDPVTGMEVGRRDAGKPGLDREHILPFIYDLHHTLLLPEMWGIDRWGQWLMGSVALLWFADCFVGFYLTLPKRRSAIGIGEPSSSQPPRNKWWRGWGKAWSIRWHSGGYRRAFDLHRAGGLWAWIFLATLALSGATLNLFPEIFRPILLTVSQYTRSANDLFREVPPNERVVSTLGFEEAVDIARVEASKRGWREPLVRIFYAYRSGYYTASFFRPGDYLSVDGMPHRRMYLDGNDGRVVAYRDPWRGTGADVFVQAQFPVHSGRILGLPGRIMISAMGLVVATLSVTGVIIWWRKRSARTLRRPKGRLRHARRRSL